MDIELQRVVCGQCGHFHTYGASPQSIEMIDRMLYRKEFSCPVCGSTDLSKTVVTIPDLSDECETTEDEVRDWEKGVFKTPKVKRMEKATVYRMEPRAIGDGYHEVEVIKNMWKCVCGLVWENRQDAEQCVWRGHVPSYQVTYGGYTNNGRRVGGRTYIIKAIRREEQ